MSSIWERYQVARFAADAQASWRACNRSPQTAQLAAPENAGAGHPVIRLLAERAGGSGG